MFRMTKPLTAVIAALMLAAPFSYAGGSSEKKDNPAAPAAPSATAAPPAPATPAGPYFTGNGGKGMSLAVLVPAAQGIAADQNYLPTMVQGVLVGDLTKLSAISVLDRLRLETVLKETESGIYKSEEDFGKLGEIANVDYALTGSITKTGAGYAMQVQVVGTGKNTVGVTKAAYSGSCTIAELDNFTGIRKASLELLTQMGVSLTDAAKKELSGGAADSQVNAQTAAARGIVAQRLGNAAEALTQYYQAAAYDPSLAEAAARANTMATSVRTGSLGANIRNDIAWRDEWVKILADAQTALGKIPHPRQPSLTQIVAAQIVPPEPVFYQGAIDYAARTAVLYVNWDIGKNVFAVPYPPEYLAAVNAYNAAFTQRADVYNKVVADLNAGLDATNRNADWKLQKLSTILRGAGQIIPRRGEVTVSAVVELLNDQGKVIGNAGDIKQYKPFGSETAGIVLGRFRFEEQGTVLTQIANIHRFTFTVKADDIGDQMSLRFTAKADPAPNNIVQVMTFTELKTARPDIDRITRPAPTELMYNIGDYGPAGGIVFYDKGKYSHLWQRETDWRYLEASPVDLVGTGYAKDLCEAYTLNGYKGWRLPNSNLKISERNSNYDTIDEIGLMYQNLKQKGLGGFGNGGYWHEDSGSNHLLIRNFSTGKHSFDQYGANSIRAVRQF